MWLRPIVSPMVPVLGVALALTLLIRASSAIRVGITETRSKTDLGIAGVTAAILAMNGATWASWLGIVLYALSYTTNLFRGEDDRTFAKKADGTTDRAAVGTGTRRPVGEEG